MFNVILQGQKVLANFDIAREELVRGMGVVREFPSVNATDEITVEMKPVVGRPLICGIKIVGH